MLKHLFGFTDVINHTRLKNKKSAIDPAFAGLWLFGKFRDAIAVELDMAIASRRPHRSHGGQFPVAAMKVQQLIKIDVRHTVSPSQHEGGLPEPRSHVLDTA